MFKLFHPKKETGKEKEKEKHTETMKESETKTKRQKKIILGERMVDQPQGQKRPRKKCYLMRKFLKPQHKK